MKLPWAKNVFQRKQELAKPGRYYGDGGTIHHTGYVDVDVDRNGHVVSVWFRCQLLPFRQTNVDDHRALEMYAAYKHFNSELSGVEIIDRERDYDWD